MMTDMQQGARVGMFFMERDLRLAGCDPTGSANAGIMVATPAQLGFTTDYRDASGNLGSNGLLDNNTEDIRYALSNDNDNDGIADGFPCNLGREIGGLLGGTGSGLQPVCENVEALNFVYLSRDEVPLDPVANPLDRDRIRYVEIAMVVRSGERLFATGDSFRNNTNYRNLQGDIILPAQNDNITRLLLTTRVLCRNIDLDVVLN
jgi:type IV pilus assembly protein PilW